jgi:hypothetical protein
MIAAGRVCRALTSETKGTVDDERQKSAQPKKKRKVDLATPRTLLRKHARNKKNGRVELKKEWSDKRIAKKAKADIELVRRAGTCTPAFASRSSASPVFGNKAL